MNNCPCYYKCTTQFAPHIMGTKGFFNTTMVSLKARFAIILSFR